MRKPVCKRCGASKFRQYGEVELTIYREVARDVENVTIHPDGSVSSKTAPRINVDSVRDALHDAEFGLEDEVRYHGFECAGCALAEDKIEDLVIPEPTIGDRVVLPDGRTVAIAAVKVFKADGLMMLAAGEWWDFDDLEVWSPHPEQQALELAA